MMSVLANSGMLTYIIEHTIRFHSHSFVRSHPALLLICEVSLMFREGGVREVRREQCHVLEVEAEVDPSRK